MLPTLADEFLLFLRGSLISLLNIVTPRVNFSVCPTVRLFGASVSLPVQSGDTTGLSFPSQKIPVNSVRKKKKLEIYFRTLPLRCPEGAGVPPEGGAR